MSVLNGAEKYTELDQFGIGGLDTLNLPDDILDIELADVRNMVFTDGLLQPRNGSLLYAAKPTGETNSPNQILVATDSNGYQYMIAVYGVNIYLYDTINSQWIKLNQTYTPATGGLFYGSTNWNIGRGNASDTFYICNGTDDVAKWVMSIGSLGVAALSADTTLTLKESSSFIIDFVRETATTISFTDPSTISDSADGFLTAGFAPGMNILVSGSASNNGVYTIATVTAGTIIVTQTSIVNEAAGATDTIAEVGIMLVQPTGGSPFQVTYTANNVSTGVLTVNGTVGSTAPIDSTVTTQLVDVPTIPTGQIVFTDSSRLYTANGIQRTSGPSDDSSQNTINGSYFHQPENFTVDSTVATSFSYIPPLGSGGILGMALFGEYITFQKRDVIAYLTFTSVAADSLGAYVLAVSCTPIIAGDGIGPASMANILNYMNTLYYPTTAQGIISFSPDTTGSQTSSGLSILSQTIQNLVTETIDFNISRTAGLGQKLYWACALPTVGINPAVNNVVLAYDLVRAAENETINSGIQVGGSAWTVFDNWNAIDIKPVNDVLYYLSANDGSIYQCNVQGNYQDAISNNPIPYTAYALSKRLNLGAPANLFRAQYIYLEGYISLNTTFYVNALFNEGGSLGTQGYVIAGTNTTIVTTIPYGGLGRFVLGSPVLGGVDLETLQAFQKPLFFRVYLEVTQALRPHNIQIQAFSNAVGSFWGISKAVLITLPENSINTSLVMGPGTVPPLTLQSLD